MVDLGKKAPEVAPEIVENDSVSSASDDSCPELTSNPSMEKKTEVPEIAQVASLARGRRPPKRRDKKESNASTNLLNLIS